MKRIRNAKRNRTISKKGKDAKNRESYLGLQNAKENFVRGMLVKTIQFKNFSENLDTFN